MEQIILIAQIYSQLHMKNYNLYLDSLKRINSGESLKEVLRDPKNLTLSSWYLQKGQSVIDKMTQDIQRSIDDGVHWIWMGHPNYPEVFYNLEYPPFCLSYFGLPVWKNRYFFSVVGSREPSEESVQWLQTELGTVIQALNLGIVSGGARGVDQVAHRVCFRTGAPTLVLVPSGLKNLYPQQLQGWKSAIVEMGGALVSEYTYSAEMNKSYFQQRNRLIAAMGVGTLIVDAKRRSGTMITAKAACDQNKSVYVLPTHARDVRGWGGLDLISEGATLVRDATDLISYVSHDLMSAQSVHMGIGATTNGTHYI